MDYYLHAVSGRIRIRTPKVKKNAEVATRVEGVVRRFRGVKTTEVNTVTGSVVVTYDHRIVSHEQIISALENEGYFDRSKAISQDDFMSRKAAEAGEYIGKVLVGYVAERALENAGLSFMSALI